MAAQKDAAGDAASHDLNCRLKSGLVSFGASAWRRAVRPRLTEREIAAEHGESGCAEGMRQGYEKRRFAVRACTVRQNEAVNKAVGKAVGAGS
jgi:hypothetical protein